MKKPDNVADTPGLLPYASNVGAPIIRPDNIDDWKLRGVNKVNKHLEPNLMNLKRNILS